MIFVQGDCCKCSPNRIDLLRHCHTLWIGDWCHLLLTQQGDLLLVFTQIQLCADKNDRYIGCVMGDFGPPLGEHVSLAQHLESDLAVLTDLGPDVLERWRGR